MRRGALRTLCLLTAVFAVFMAALAPTFSQAMQRRDGGPRVLVCTPSGPAWIRADAGKSDGSKHPTDGGHAFEHCPYCSVHAASLGLPPAVLQPPPLPLSHALHWRYSAATPTLDVWSDALSRGPPARA